MGYPTPTPPPGLAPEERARYIDPTTVLVQKASLRSKLVISDLN